PRIEDADKLKQFYLDDINYGMEAASSTITVLRDPRPDLAKEQELVSANLRTAISVHRWFRAFFATHSINLLYVCNGRYSSQMPAIRAAADYNIPYITFETAHDAHKFALAENTYFHDLEHKKTEIESLWNNAE